SALILPITGAMSLDTTLARVSALETAFTPPSVQPAQSTPATTAPATTTSPATATGGSTFATQLQGAMAPASVSQPGGGAAAMVQIAEAEVGQAEQPPGSNNPARIATYRSPTPDPMAREPWRASYPSWVPKQ